MWFCTNIILKNINILKHKCLMIIKCHVYYTFPTSLRSVQFNLFYTHISEKVLSGRKKLQINEQS